MLILVTPIMKIILKQIIALVGKLVNEKECREKFGFKNTYWTIIKYKKVLKEGHMGNSAAFFDIDGTLYREGLIAEIFKKLVKSDIIKPEKWYNEVRPEYQRWDRRQGNYDDYLLKIADIYTEAVKGLHKSQIDFIAKRVVEQKGDRVYTFTRDKIKWHRTGPYGLSPFLKSQRISERDVFKHGFDDYLGLSM